MNTYIIGYICAEDYIRPLDTGARYSFLAARDKAEKMNKLNQGELMALKGKTFVSINTEVL